MNIVTMLGFVTKKEKNENETVVTLKIEKNLSDDYNGNDFFDWIDININKTLFAKELKLMRKGNYIVIYGRGNKETFFSILF